MPTWAWVLCSAAGGVTLGVMVCIGWVLWNFRDWNI